MDEKRVINRDYIGVVVEECGLLQYKEIDINYPRELVAEMTAMEKDEQSTIIDAQRLFWKYYPKDSTGDKGLNYLFPNSYESTYNVWSHAPKFFNQQDFPIDKVDVGGLISTCHIEEYQLYPCGFNTEKEYVQFLEHREQFFFCENQILTLKEFQEQYDRDPERYAKEIIELEKLENSDFKYTIEMEDLREKFKDEVRKRTERDLKQLENEIRSYFIKGCVRYVHAICYDRLRENLPKSAFMFSTDNLGWTTYKHQLSKIERFEIHTNYGYGSRSYAYCNLFYKDIPILPYTDAIKYSSVAWLQIVNYTRSFVPQREVCWEKTFDFVIAVSNLIKTNPKKFIDEFIVDEISQLLKQLRELLRNSPKELKEHFEKYKIEDRRTTFVWNTGLDQESYKIFPEELADAEKVEKITGCLFFLDNMRKLNEFIPVIRVFINDLIALNNQITPMIDSYLSKLSEEIQQNMTEIEDLAEAIKEVKSRMKKCKEENAPDLIKALNLKEDLLNDYLENHPLITDAYQEYTIMREKLRELDCQKEEKSTHLRLRKNFSKRFEECKERINRLMK